MNSPIKNIHSISILGLACCLIFMSGGCINVIKEDDFKNQSKLDDEMTQSDYSIGLWSMYQDRAAYELEVISGTKVPRGGMNSTFDLKKNLELLNKQSAVISVMKLNRERQNQVLKNWTQNEVDAANTLREFNHKKLLRSGEVRDYNKLIKLQLVELNELFEKREKIGLLLKK